MACNREKMKARSLQEVWLADRSVFMSDARAAYELAQRANGAGECLLALEIADAALEALPPGDARAPLLQQRALALARLGSTHQALATLEKLRASGPDDGETLGVMGRVYKDLAAGAADSAERHTL